MLRIIENRTRAAFLDDLALLHDDDAIADVVGGRQIMGDVDDGQPEVPLQLTKEVDDGHP